jgi:hypothetical protein
MKLTHAINLLEHEAYEWVKPALMATLERKPTFVQTWEAFKKEFLKVFSDIDMKELSYQCLQALKQMGSASNKDCAELQCLSNSRRFQVKILLLTVASF